MFLHRLDSLLIKCELSIHLNPTRLLVPSFADNGFPAAILTKCLPLVALDHQKSLPTMADDMASGLRVISFVWFRWSYFIAWVWRKGRWCRRRRFGCEWTPQVCEEWFESWHRGADNSDVNFDHRPDVHRANVIERVFGECEDSDAVETDYAVSCQ